MIVNVLILIKVIFYLTYKIKIKAKSKFYIFNCKYNSDTFIKNILACVAVLLTLNLILNKFIESSFISIFIPFQPLL